ncbi:MAG TPA: hypothetical protein VHC70_06185 [Phycisphaerales bacterium]|nr:hypothetical protein [Phycisphaerales bacterium]
MSTTPTRRLALTLASAGLCAAPALAQPVHQIPIVRTPTPATPTQPSTQPGQPAAGAPQATVPVTIGGQTINVTPNDAASVAAWKEKLRQFAIMKGIEPIRRTDGLPTYLNSKDYIVPTNDGKGQGIVALPAGFEIGVWFSGPGPDGNAIALNGMAVPVQPLSSAPKPDAPTPLTQLAEVSGARVQTEIPLLNPVAMTPEAVEAARKQFPKEQGWNEIWLPTGGKLFARATPVEIANGVSTLNDAWKAGLDRPGAQSVNDLAKSYKAWCEACYPRACKVTDPYAWRKPQAVEAQESPKYTIASDVIPSQIQLIEDSQKVVQDDGRLERALAISELQQLTTWKRGVQRLAGVYLAHPELVTVGLSQDFSDLNDPAMRKMINQIVADANRNTDPKGLIAAASLIASDQRIEAALNTLSRARRFTTEQADKDAIDKLFLAVNALPRR